MAAWFGIPPGNQWHDAIGWYAMTGETYRCLYCQISMNDSSEWIDHINSEEHRNMLLNRHKVQRDPGDEDQKPWRGEDGLDYGWSAPHREPDND